MFLRRVKQTHSFFYSITMPHHCQYKECTKKQQDCAALFLLYAQVYAQRRQSHAFLLLFVREIRKETNIKLNFSPFVSFRRTKVLDREKSWCYHVSNNFIK